MWQRLLRQPQNLWMRRALFQIHLWAGIAAGIYVLLISASGSAVVFRAEISNAFFTGPDHPASRATRLLGQLVDFHDNLLYGDTGRKINGIGAIIMTVLCLTGLVIWWPGIQAWRRDMSVDWKSNWKRLNWNLHNVLGLWTFVFTLMWGLSGAYLVFQEELTVIPTFNALDVSAQDRLGVRFGNWMIRMHFGRFAGWPVKSLWVAIGLAPVVLFVTGALMWWNRVLRPRLYAIGRESSVPALDR
jgi:uncharacterized iron-regulated membrane protein